MGESIQEAWVRYQAERIVHWDNVAAKMDQSARWRGQYHQRLRDVYRSLVPPGRRLLEIGCAQGDLLSSLDPGFGVGVDLSEEMVTRARRSHPGLQFRQADAHRIDFNERFDMVILSDLVNELWDVQAVFHQVEQIASPGTRIIVNFVSHLWGPLLAIAESAGQSGPQLQQNWLTIQDVSALLSLANFEIIRHRREILLPVRLPFLSTIANRFLVKLWPFEQLAMTNVLVARPTGARRSSDGGKPSVSVIIPARNEAGNIAALFARVPELGSATELVFVEGGSQDNTYETIARTMAEYPTRQSSLLRQPGTGKGDAVRLGFAHASGELLIILDADLTVAPEDLPKFVDVLLSGKADFVNGCRLVYPMEGQAMRFLNLVANKFFSVAFSWLLGQPIKDTLCGTKALWKSDYEAIAANRSYFGDFDPFGDFDLLFGAAKLNLKIIDVPVRYRDRTYGTTNIHRWTHGALLLKMTIFAARKLKFV
jgi:Glycosyl transferase family 2/Methyltransferase domain